MTHKRFEYKYLIQEDHLDELRKAVMPHVEFDQHIDSERSNSYTVRSIYYDTFAMDAYWEKIEGIPHRKKYRIRGYNQHSADSIDFLEIKNKDGRYITKNRAPLHHADTENLLLSSDIDRYYKMRNGSSREHTDAQKFLYHYNRKGLRAVILIVYEREAYVGSYDPLLRITFDKKLRSTLFPSISNLYEESAMVTSLPGYFILEVKFSEGLPGWLRRVISRLELRRQALSKYTICLDTNAEQHMLDTQLIRSLRVKDSKRRSQYLYT
jgi:VTC domain-containing protein